MGLEPRLGGLVLWGLSRDQWSHLVSFERGESSHHNEWSMTNVTADRYVCANWFGGRG